MKQSEAEHTVRFAKLLEWLDGGAKSPHELVLKKRLREALGRRLGWHTTGTIRKTMRGNHTIGSTKREDGKQPLNILRTD